jgi:predicted methyltransferase
MKRRTAIAWLTAGTWMPVLADEALKAVIASTSRTPAFAARDGWRHPYETLSFFGIRPDMTVVEISPGSGWYTEILAPYLRDRGRLILAGDDPASTSAYNRGNAERMQHRLKARPEVYDRVQLTVFEPPHQLRIAAPGTVDLVLTFRNVHNWAAQGDDVVRAVFGSVHDVLKPGGVCGVVEHRLPVGRVQRPRAAGGYLQTAYVTRLAESAGLVFVAASEINANPRDSADHEGGVWALPPNYANGHKDRARYAAIGESDRMTLKFIKR